ncbi:hypothetical protein Syun_017196 [Stephania yunnanensis]|uniref:Uncharacterized protein n=1 Tax=Stephania yunnanensis TaxID=152371 RepID=A0AAP0J6H0_9MAGN
MEGFLSHMTDTSDLPDARDGYGLMISKLHGTDISNCSTGILGDDDPIYLSLGEIPISISKEIVECCKDNRTYQCLRMPCSPELTRAHQYYVQVAELIGFQRCMHSCLENLEAVPWVGDEEEEKLLLCTPKELLEGVQAIEQVLWLYFQKWKHISVADSISDDDFRDGIDSVSVPLQN